MHPAAREALLTALEDGWADPARLHREGRQARLLLDQAREAVAAELGSRPDELSFTSSGTQALQLAVLGAVQARQSAARGPGHLVTSAVEHSAAPTWPSSPPRWSLARLCSPAFSPRTTRSAPSSRSPRPRRPALTAACRC